MAISTKTAAVLLGMLACASAQSAEDQVLVIKDHAFVPAELTIPANTKVRIVVKNQDPTPAEFESVDLNREKVIKGGSEAVVFIGPLDPGTYVFFDEFHKDTTTGRIVVKP
jgi:plastocyanin